MSVEDFNPKIHRTNQQKKRSMAFNFADVRNPISLEISDPEELKTLFTKWPLIPYAYSHGNSAVGLLHFLNSGRFISSSLGACHESIKTYAFGNKIDIGHIVDEDFDLGDELEPLTVEQKKTFRQFLKENVVLGDQMSYSQITEFLYDSYRDNGNYFIELIHTETAGVKTSKIQYHPTTNCCYRVTPQDGAKIIVISPVWNEQYLEKNPPAQIPLFPNYKKSADGTLRTIIHVKNGNMKWYGRPDWIACWVDVFREYQDSDYLVKTASNRFTGEVFMEIEDDDLESGSTIDDEEAIEAGFDSVTDRIEENFTAKGDDPQSIIVTTRPYGASNAFIYQFKPNTNENFFKTSKELTRQSILENNQWSERLLGNAKNEGFSNDTHVKELKVKDISVLEKYRMKISYGLNLCLNEIIKFHNYPELAEIGFYYKSSLEKLQEKTVDFKTTIDAFGVGVRAGVITPTIDDEEFFRNFLQVAPVNSEVEESWSEDGGYRRPITLKGSEDSESEETRTGEGKTEKSEKEEK